MPAFCVAEAIARFRTMEREAHATRAHMVDRRRQAARMDLDPAQGLALALDAAIQEQDRLVEALPGELTSFMERLFESPIERISEDYEIVRRAHGYVESLELSRGDALVLAAIVEHGHRRVDVDRAFLSGNTKDFGHGRPAGSELRARGIKFMAKARDALGWLASG
ncbi:MAG: hypothetical protein KDK70_18355 [Myxococcales bacterium]|nr:hypothetical protein [Myxococcales bacterium]